MAWRELLGMAVALAWSTGCSKTIPVGGLVVVMRTDGSLQPEPDMLHVDVAPPDGGMPYRNASYLIDGAHAFPITFAVDSNGDPRASVSIVAEVSSSPGSKVLEAQRYRIDAIPTEDVAELDVMFSAACARQAPGDAGTGAACCPEDGCSWSGGTCLCNAGLLPGYPVDAGKPTSRPMAVAEAGSPPDATLDGGMEGGAVVGRAGACDAGAIQCGDVRTPQQCASTGQWRDQPTCAPAVTYCFQGACVPAPPSCLGTDYVGCESYGVPGGHFLRSDDPLHDAGAPATVSGFRLDAFEIPVWRFRSFVSAVRLGGGIPDAGDGRHVHLAEGEGLNAGGDAGLRETGWDPSWDTLLQPASWDENLVCSNSATWTPQAGATEALPINCATWYEAYAFCIWDGGFLPSEAEWNYAAAGGAEQRLYPWGSTDPGTRSEYADYGCYYPQLTPCATTLPTNIAVVGSFPAGLGLYGQADLAGNVSEWTLDSYESTYPTPCMDCAALAPGTQRVFRGGGYDRGLQYLYTSSRVPSDPASRYQDVGFRCARTP
jgi:sulfatase modifying factor 1